jgi:hypothetical protein
VTVFELRLFVLTKAEMPEDMRSEDPALAGFYEAMERANVEKIEREMCFWAISINVLVIRCPTYIILVHMCQVLKRCKSRIKV